MEILERALREIKECREVAQLEKVGSNTSAGRGTAVSWGWGFIPEERPVMGRLVNEVKKR